MASANLRQLDIALHFYLDARDEAGAQIVAEMRCRGTSRVAVALAQSVDHVLGLFKMLRIELAFQVGRRDGFPQVVGGLRGRSPGGSRYRSEATTTESSSDIDSCGAEQAAKI